MELDISIFYCMEFKSSVCNIRELIRPVIDIGFINAICFEFEFQIVWLLRLILSDKYIEVIYRNYMSAP